MRSNNLSSVERSLKFLAKRYKSVKYSLGLTILFLMLGVNAFSEDIHTKETLKTSTSNLQEKIQNLRKENEKQLEGLKLELIQLMEQGNQVLNLMNST